MIRSLPIPAWPGADRLEWEEACTPGQRMRRGGRASHLKAITRDDLARRYGYFLQVLAEAERLDLDGAPAALIAPDAVALYLTRARAAWSSVTLAQSISTLRRMGEILHPAQDYAWFKEIETDLRAEAQPKSRFDRLVTTDSLVEAGLTLVQEADLASHRPERHRACLARNGLILALLALCPIRLKNFTALTIGTSFRLERGCWWILLDGAETKSGRPDERPVPDMLDHALQSYLLTYRRCLLRSPGEASQEEPAPGPLWISKKGQPVTYSSMEKAITETTLRTLGVAVNPHAFRMAGASTAAAHAGAMPHLASALLQHTDRRTTDLHYNRATTFQAADELCSILRRL